MNFLFFYYFFFGGYELPQAFMISGGSSVCGFPCEWILCGVALLGGFSLLDINQGWMVVEVYVSRDFYNLTTKHSTKKILIFGMCVSLV